MNDNTQYWSAFMRTPLTRDQAIDAAARWLGRNKDAPSVALDEIRPPAPDDLPDHIDEVVELLSEKLAENEALGHDGGGPDMPPAPQDGPELEDLRSALSAYIAAHTDLGMAAWVYTGRCLIVHRDGQVEECGTDEDGGGR